MKSWYKEMLEEKKKMSYQELGIIDLKKYVKTIVEMNRNKCGNTLRK